MAKTVRRAQTLSPFGVGGIMDVEGESLIAVDITHWKYQGEVLNEPRLAAVLGVTKFKMAQPAPDNAWMVTSTSGGVPYFRFPQALFCSKCRRMYRWTRSRETGGIPTCSVDRRPLTPMRFVMACPRGHLADVPWDIWVHREGVKCEAPDLRFYTTGGGSGLESIGIACERCGSRQSLAGIATPNSLKALKVACPGLHPWENPEQAKACDAVPQVLQRGATNLTFPSIVSSIDIPPYSNWDAYSEQRRMVTVTNEFSIIKDSPTHPLVGPLIDLIASKTGMDAATVRKIVDSELAQGQAIAVAAPRKDPADLLPEEYRAFLQPDRQADERDHFIKRTLDLRAYLQSVASGPYRDVLAETGKLIAVLAQVTKLREVRALRGFSRLAPVEDETGDGEGPGRFETYGPGGKIAPTLVPADLDRLRHTERWLPAIEVFGEGIFLGLDEGALQAWESDPRVRQRIQPLCDRYAQRPGFLALPTPRLVLLHTLAHLLIRQLSFECGYSLASLRERIYAAEATAGEPMAGILIYTAAGDAEGTLGGLVREGEAERLLPTLIKALQGAEWCSSDPLCRESRGQGLGAMNLAACHACALLPETSCTLSNRLLDRTVLLGGPGASGPGFFAGALAALTAAMGTEA